MELLVELKCKVLNKSPIADDDRISLAVDELYCRKNNNRVKRLISTVKLRYPAADMNTLSKSG